MISAGFNRYYIERMSNCFRVSHSGISAAVLCVMREPDYLCDHEQAVQAGLRRRDRLLVDKGEPNAVRQ